MTKPQDPNEMSIPVRAGLAIFMLTIGLFFPETPLSPERMSAASGGSRGGYAPEMVWIVIPFLYVSSYLACKRLIKDIKAKKWQDKNENGEP